MTSSLVGSEMCIRDSLTIVPFSPVTGSWRTRSSKLGQSLRPSPACAPTVSYTHLTLPTICSV
eukprot:8499622-Prorocentrum_lima.AAC.1